MCYTNINLGTKWPDIVLVSMLTWLSPVKWHSPSNRVCPVEHNNCQQDPWYDTTQTLQSGFLRNYNYIALVIGMCSKTWSQIIKGAVIIYGWRGQCDQEGASYEWKSVVSNYLVVPSGFSGHSNESSVRGFWGGGAKTSFPIMEGWAIFECEQFFGFAPPPPVNNDHFLIRSEKFEIN